MKLNFDNEYYLKVAEEVKLKSREGYYQRCNIHSPEDAFMLLINGVEEKDLDNLCSVIKQHCPNLTTEQCYRLTQGDVSLINNPPSIVKQILYSCAMECLKSGKHLGSSTIADGKINTSSWISHSLYEAKLAGNMAKILGEDSKKAKTLAILHDYGRKFIHTFEHVPIGFQKLVDLGWEDEAIGTLTHSFLNGGRCANCDPAEEGFYIDEEGCPQWQSEENKDDVARFLDGYTYNIYDEILNISDLMATDRAIVSPQERVNDIRTRKPADSKNEEYFLTELTNKLNEFLVKMGGASDNKKTKANGNVEAKRKYFESVSAKFFEAYKQKEQER